MDSQADGDLAPTFEDLAIDDSLGDLERIQKYAYSNIALQRLVHVKMLSETARAIGFESTKNSLLPLLSTLVTDVEFVVRQHLAEQFSGLCKFFVEDGGESGYTLLVNSLLPLLSKLVGDSQAEVRHAAGEGLVAVAELLRVEDQGQHILTIVLQLSHDDEQDELRMAAVVLLNQLAEHLGPDLCHQFVTPEIISLSEDPVFRVRKATAMNIDNVCRTAGPQDTMERLLPAYLRLTKDDIWGVRKACAESLCAVSNAVAEEVRVEQLVQVLERFVTDVSKWVRSAAFQQLGPFLATLPQEHITPSLLRYYTSMAVSSEDSAEPADDELKLFCAFSFPAVALTLGNERWSELSPTFTSLVRDAQWQVRRTLSFSLHEVAKILGPELAEKELLGTFDLLLHDLDEVKAGVITHLGNFLDQLGPPCRESYLPILKEIHASSTPTNWRFREILASQLPLLGTLFTPPATFSVVVPLVFELLNDSVACVRETTYEAVGVLVKRLGQSEVAWRDELLKKVVEFGTATSYQERKVFIKVCELLVVDMEEELFRSVLLPQLVILADDKVANIRLMIGRMFCKVPAHVANTAEAKAINEKLMEDEDQDVLDVVAGGISSKERKAKADTSQPALPPPAADAKAEVEAGTGSKSGAGDEKQAAPDKTEPAAEKSSEEPAATGSESRAHET